MHILTTPDGTQRVKVVLRVSSLIQESTEISLYDKSERKEIIANNDSTEVSFSNGIATIDFTFEQDLVENRLYSLTIKDLSRSNPVIYKGLAFTTNQTDYNKFDVHKDDYVVEDSYDNEYVIL